MTAACCFTTSLWRWHCIESVSIILCVCTGVYYSSDDDVFWQYPAVLVSSCGFDSVSSLSLCCVFIQLHVGVFLAPCGLTASLCHYPVLSVHVSISVCLLLHGPCHLKHRSQMINRSISAIIGPQIKIKKMRQGRNIVMFLQKVQTGCRVREGQESTGWILLFSLATRC